MTDRRSEVRSREAIAAIIDPVAFDPISLGDTHPGWLHRRETALETADKIRALGAAQARMDPPYDAAFHENQLDKIEALKAIERGEFTDLPPLGDSKRVPTQGSPKRQYYYRMNECKADHSDCPDCVCWHDEGTGPIAGREKKAVTWRTAPSVPSAEGK